MIFANRLLSREIRVSLGQAFAGGSVRALHGRSPNATPIDFSVFWEVFCHSEVFFGKIIILNGSREILTFTKPQSVAEGVF